MIYQRFFTRSLSDALFFTVTPTTNPAPLPSASPILFLASLDSPVSTCTDQNIAWSYNGPDTRLMIAVTNMGVPQPSPPSSNKHDNVGSVHRTRDSNSITEDIVRDMDPSLLHAPWKVNVPSGWYQIVVTNGFQRLDQTEPFYVQDGPDTSCVIGAPAASPSSTASQAPQATTTTLAPVASTSKDNHVGVIIGVVAGVVVALIVILIAFLCFRRRKHAQDVPHGGYPPAGGLRRGWNGLGSLTSVHSIKADRASRDLVVAAREPASHVEEGVSRSGRSTPFSLEEKISSSPVLRSDNPFDDAKGGITLATLPSNARRSASLASSTQYSPPLRNPSIDAIVSSYDPDASPRSTDLSSSPQDSLAATEMSPSYSSSSSVSPIERNSDSTGSQSAVRKMPRKPVPAYDPSLHTSNTPSPYLENASPLVRTRSTPATVSSVAGQSHYAKNAPANVSNPEGAGVLPRKSSFGPGGIEGKPVHYLIPDMPLPRHD